jgi:hypothetical protein
MAQRLSHSVSTKLSLKNGLLDPKLYNTEVGPVYTEKCRYLDLLLGDDSASYRVVIDLIETE